MTARLPRGRIIHFPSREPWTPPRWRAVRIGQLAENPAGLRQLERLVIRFLRRGWRLLRALDEQPGMDLDEVEDGPLLALLALDGTWLDLLCRIARHEVGPARVRELVVDVRRLSREQTRLRQAVYDHLAPDLRRRIAASEQSQEVSDHEVRQAVVDMLVVLDDEEEPPVGDDFSPALLRGVASSALLTEVNTAQRHAWEARPLPVRHGPLRGSPSSAGRHRLPLGPPHDRPPRARGCGGTASRSGRRAGLGGRRARAVLPLAAAGGALPAVQLREAYGSELDDGWFWRDRPPTSALGRCRSAGLVFVGLLGPDGSQAVVAVVPRELREGLARRLDVRLG